MDTAEVNRPRTTGKPKINPNYTYRKPKPVDQRPQAARLIFILGIICLLLSACVTAYSYKQSKDIADILYLVYGVLEFAACAGFSAIITLLDDIRKNTE